MHPEEVFKLFLAAINHHDLQAFPSRITAFQAAGVSV
jgi:hypothetical protein